MASKNTRSRAGAGGGAQSRFFSATFFDLTVFTDVSNDALYIAFIDGVTTSLLRCAPDPCVPINRGAP